MYPAADIMRIDNGINTLENGKLPIEIYRLELILYILNIKGVMEAQK